MITTNELGRRRKRLTAEKLGSEYFKLVGFLNSGSVCARLGFGNVSGGGEGT
jgi:hypothetical protein